jgi:hypothetical protein
MHAHIYYINLNYFKQRIEKLTSACFNVQKNPKKQTHVHAHVCIFRQNDYHLQYLQMLEYHPGKFHFDPLSSF